MSSRSLSLRSTGMGVVRPFNIINRPVGRKAWTRPCCFCNIFESVFPRLGHKNEVFGHAWTVLGRGLDTFWTAAKLKSWSVSELAYFLTKKDMEGPAQHLRAQGVSGADFAAMTEQMLQQELRLSIFTARKLVHVREAHLAQA